jgi:hypothetical protein
MMGWDYVSAKLRLLMGTLSIPHVIHEYGAAVERYWPSKPKDSEKTYPSATLATNTTWTAQGANPGLHGEKPVTNHLSYAQPIH